jgi:kynurenine formamidase
MPVFPGDDLPRLNKNIDSENGIVHFDIKTGMHVGTHMDGPLHMLSNGRKLSEMSVEKFVANGHIIDARGREEVGVDLLENKEINEGDCVLIYTGFDEKFRDPSFYTDYPDLTEDFARRLVDFKIKFVGLDAPSPDKAPYNIHRILLKEEILIIESMNNLSQLLGIKKFEVIALPAKFDAEAAPVRVIAKIS